MNPKQTLENIPITDTISLYVAEATRTPLLSHIEEQQLMQHIERARKAARKLETLASEHTQQYRELQNLVQRGRQARSRLITANTRLVLHVAQKYRGLGVPLSDLIQEGNLGLMRAIEKFDYRRGNRFSTYATWWIRQNILRALTQQSRTVRLPNYLRAKYSKIQRTIQDYECRHGTQPTHREIASTLGMSEFAVRKILSATQVAISLNFTVDEDATSLQDNLPDHTIVHPHRQMCCIELMHAVQDALCTLPARQARILTLRYGLLGSKPHSRKEIGEKVGLNRERVRQLEVEALNHLRRCGYTPRLHDFLD